MIDSCKQEINMIHNNISEIDSKDILNKSRDDTFGYKPNVIKLNFIKPLIKSTNTLDESSYYNKFYPKSLSKYKRIIINLSRSQYKSLQNAATKLNLILEEKGKTELKELNTVQRYNLSSTYETSVDFNRENKSLIKDKDNLCYQIVTKYRKTYYPESGCQIYWFDVTALSGFISTLKCWQRINHFPDITELSRKAKLSKSLNNFIRKLPGFLCSFL